jgi:voltage-gated potassium channel
MHTFLRALWQRNQHQSLAFSSDELGQILIRSSLLLMLLVFLHTAAMVLFEDLSGADALWLTLTTATTVGYGDISAVTLWGRVSTVVLLYMGGIFVLAKVVGDYFDYRSGKRSQQKCGDWEWHMQEHILFINTPGEDGENFFLKVIEQIRASVRYHDSLIQILTRRFPGGLPARLSEMAGISHRNRDALDDGELLKVDADKAAVIIILAKQERNADSDSRTFDILHRIQETKTAAMVIVECVNDANRERFRKAGADVVMRPIRAYPEMLVRGLVAPGSEQIIENMFTSATDEYIRCEVKVQNVAWKTVVSRLIENDMGTAIAYIDQQTGAVETNPHANTQIDASAIFVIANEGTQIDKARFSQLLVPQ